MRWSRYAAVLTIRPSKCLYREQEFPRLGLMKGVRDNMLHLCKTKPETTYDNTVGEWGDRYLQNEGYSREGKLTQYLLETCDLDDKEPN